MIASVEMLAHRAYPGLKASGLCSMHGSEDDNYACMGCYPDKNELLNAHMQMQNELYAELLELSGLVDPPNGRVGLDAIVAELRKNLRHKDEDTDP